MLPWCLLNKYALLLLSFLFTVLEEMQVALYTLARPATFPEWFFFPPFSKLLGFLQ